MSDINSHDPRTLGKSLCIITGASRGFGRALALQVVHLLEPGSVLLLVARSGAQLQEVKDELQNFRDEPERQIHCITADLSTKDGVEETVSVASQEAEKELDHVLLINNAGSLGKISSFVSFTDPKEVDSYMSFNVSSALALTAGILQMFPRRPGLRWTVVNVSSVYALEASPLWVLYCTAKAARTMMFKVLAEDEPNVKVLNYSPGPMETEMQEKVREITGTSVDVMACKDSAATLIKLIIDNEFPSGTHLDFFES
ncbi:sepiapterin reductase-like [Gouania willdenowi]|uniref:Sepiapterin reductase n=1 Tax=Gouania willdenowi TaxID=441366 RepID=A0A8C5NAQ2_GOUWI|nr:sepiapterin reductase-like [Gouania willdenowi]